MVRVRVGIDDRDRVDAASAEMIQVVHLVTVDWIHDQRASRCLIREQPGSCQGAEGIEGRGSAFP